MIFIGPKGKRNNRLSRNNGQRQYIYGDVLTNGEKKLVKIIYHEK